LLIPAHSKDPAKGKILTDCLTWMLDNGEGMAKDLNYAPLPASVAEKVRAKIKLIH